MVNTDFNNISAISRRSVLLVEETWVLGENHQPVSRHWQTLSHDVVSSAPRPARGSNSQLKLGKDVNVHKVLYYNIRMLKLLLLSNWGPSWLWSYGSWIYDYLCNQWLSVLTLWVRIPLRRGVLETISCDTVCQWLATDRWFSSSTPSRSVKDWHWYGGRWMEVWGLKLTIIRTWTFVIKSNACIFVLGFGCWRCVCVGVYVYNSLNLCML